MRFCGDGSIEQITLHEVAAEFVEGGSLVLVLYAFSDSHKVKGVSHFYHGVDNLCRALDIP